MYKYIKTDALASYELTGDAATATVQPTTKTLVLTQPGNNPGEKNKGLELGALFEAMRSSLPTDTLVVDESDENPSRYLIYKLSKAIPHHLIWMREMLAFV